MLLAEVATASRQITATSGRRDKIALLARCLQRAATDDDPSTVALAVSYLSGELRQRRTGIGYAALRDTLPAAPAAAPTLTLTEVDAAFQRSQELSGAGSQAARTSLVAAVLSRATADEAALLRGLLSGELRQGAQSGLLLEAVAVAADAPATEVRRAVTLSGSLAEVADAVLSRGRQALGEFTLQVGQPLSPMLAKTAPSLSAALTTLGPSAVEWKLDGIRIQVHRDGDDVRVFTRTLDEVTDRVPEVEALARGLAVRSVVLDAEAIALRPDGRPRAFQETASRVATRGARAAAVAESTPLTTFVFDVLSADGVDLTGEPLTARRRVLESVAPAHVVVPQLVAGPDDGPRAEEFAADALARGHEGVVVKALDSPYAMGRRASGWLKVKPVHTLDLVVLAAEWGHGRRAGWLSNLHLGALDPDGRFGPPGGFVMLGKTFKGMTDELLTWQTGELVARAQGPTDGWVVPVRPELVVEIALDGVQTSPRYPASVALRFARVVRYRPDKTPEQADTIESVERLRAG
ncbi:ATP-dependent DNA ligase [Angustibacter sp. McL0619]|uniref:ATP-dependent DNA ligase n=1 Tax=Angustibacter sp. McL0619 TaxID=3415676 RepID=UPI003CF0DA04